MEQSLEVESRANSKRTQVATWVSGRCTQVEAEAGSISVWTAKVETPAQQRGGKGLRRRKLAVVEGNASKGMSGEYGEGHEDGIWLQNQEREAGLETARTPWPVAGRNKPAGFHEEQTVGVGKNDKGGRCSMFGNIGPKVSHFSE